MNADKLYKINEAEVLLHQMLNDIYGPAKGLQIVVPDPQFGHLSTNAPMIYSKMLKLSIDEVFDSIRKKLREAHFVKEVNLVKGFCNIFFQDEFISDGLRQILDLKSHYGSKKKETPVKVNVEYISANPTGDLHVGHLRGLYGDILSKALTFLGYDVTREYYVNDCGNQIYILGRSVFYEYAKIMKIDFPKPDEVYPGEHITAIAKNIADRGICEYSWENDSQMFMQTAISSMLERIRGELARLNIEFDVWKFESSLHAEGYVDKAVELLENKGYISEEIMGEVKSKRGHASSKPIKVFRKDEYEKAVTKADGSYTYFAGDIAYHYAKIQDGYDWIITALGADHTQHADLMREVVPLLGDVRYTVMLFQVVKFKQNDQEMKMSKRGGVTLKPSDILEELPDPNILRFIMASKAHNTHFVIDIDTIAKISSENPFFDVQYAHARSASLLRKAATTFKSLKMRIDFNTLTPSMRELSYMLIQWPKEVDLIEKTLNIHCVPAYIQKLAKKFNSIWSEKDSRWILPEDEANTSSRMMLALCFKYTISAALAILGIEAYDEMVNE